MALADLVRTLPRRRFARELVLVGAGQLATMATRLVGVRMLTELVDPAVFGVVGLTIGVAVLARNVLCAPILEASWRFFADAAQEGRIAQHRTLLARMLRTRAFLAALALWLGGAAWGFWTGSPDLTWSFAAVALLTVLEALRMFERGLLNASRRQLHHAAWTVADEALRFACAIAAIHWFGPEVVWVLLGYAVGVLAGIGLFWRARVRGDGQAAEPGWTRERTLQVGRYALPLSLLAVVGWLFNFSDRYVLAGIVGTEATGVYVAAYGLASQPFLLTANILGLTFRPIYNAAAVRDDRRREREVFLLWLLLTVAVLSAGVALMSWLAEPLTSLLLAERYREAAELLPWIGAAYALQGCSVVFDAVVYAQKRTKVLVAVQLVAAPTSVALYFLLIPRMAALGAAIGTLAGMAVSLTAVVLLSGALPRLVSRAARSLP